jgi:PTS system galactitol-specific IIA component
MGMGSAFGELFLRDAVYVIDAQSQEEVFDQLGERLMAAGLVREGYLPHVKRREATYPTGLSMAPVDPRFPNIAVPHTETEYATCTCLVPVKLVNPVTWHDMIDVDRTFEVGFLFAILNVDKSSEAGLLAVVMDFINSNDPDELVDFFALDDPGRIYDFLVSHSV